MKTYTQEEVDNLLDRNTTQVTTQVLNQKSNKSTLKDLCSKDEGLRDEVVKLLDKLISDDLIDDYLDEVLFDKKVSSKSLKFSDSDTGKNWISKTFNIFDNYYMKRNNEKWNWKIDQWFEDKVWAKIPKEHSSPHFFFLLGFLFAHVLIFLVYFLFKL